MTIKGFRYIKVHEDMPDHPKVQPLSDAAFRLLVASWCWSRKYGTDGAMPAKVWATRKTAKVRAELVSAGLVHVDGERVHFHDFLEWQKSADELEAAREQRRSAGQAGGLARAKRVAKKTPSESLSEMASETQPEGEGEGEGEGEKTPSVSARKRAIEPDWHPSEADLDWAKVEAPLVNTERETASFVDYWTDRGVKRGDWSRSWRPWMRRAQENAENRRPLRAVNTSDPQYAWDV